MLQFDLRNRRLPALVALLLAAVGLLPTLRFAWWRIRDVRGWEADAIAKAIVGGHGFSVPGTSHWLWEMWKGDPNTYFPTAWVDPVFTYTLAAAHWLFGTHVYWAMYALAFACIAGILLCAYHTAKRLGGPWAGVLAVAFIAANSWLGRSFFDDVSNSALASCVVAVLGLICVRYFERPSTSRLLAMGLLAGFTTLTCPAAETFLPFLAVIVFMRHLQLHPREFVPAARSALMTFALAAAVIAPWTIRNYLTFHEFVLVRNGGGQIAWDGTVGVASTFVPGAAQSPLPAPWQADGPRDAVQKMLVKETRIPIHHYQVESVMAAPPPGYEKMNEAQRDKFYLARTEEFIERHPGPATAMAMVKLEVFATRLGTLGIVSIVFAIIGALLFILDPRSWPLTLLAVSYCAPFNLIVAYYGRYRAPIEPILAILAAACISLIVRTANRKLNLFAPLASSTEN
jgi:hypothetical protein